VEAQRLVLFHGRKSSIVRVGGNVGRMGDEWALSGRRVGGRGPHQAVHRRLGQGCALAAVPSRSPLASLATAAFNVQRLANQLPAT
jgi:hypothetical protein